MTGIKSVTSIITDFNETSIIIGFHETFIIIDLHDWNKERNLYYYFWPPWLE